MPSTPAPLETRLEDEIRAIDASGPEFEFVESIRAHVFRALQRNWDRWPGDDQRWSAVLTLIAPGPSDHALLEEGRVTCSAVIDHLDSLATTANCANPQAMALLDAEMAKLAQLVEQVREYQGTLDTWGEIIARIEAVR